jgi:tetratricopeptide (TPR) repeat protein
MTRQKISFLFFLMFFPCGATAQNAPRLWVSPDAISALDKIYDGNSGAAIELSRRMQMENPDQPLGFLIEAEAKWWDMWCISAEYKYGIIMPRHRGALPTDREYLELAAKISALAERQIKTRETAESRFFNGMGHALTARLYGLRGETRNTAKAGIRARENFERALALDPDFADADLGLGLYNYYADTLSGVARMLRFFMGMPGGTKSEGTRLLRRAISDGVLTPTIARFYLGILLHNYDQQYETALEIMLPLPEKYPHNPLFQLAVGDLYAKLGRRELAAGRYRAAAELTLSESECAAHLHNLAQVALTALNTNASQ